MAELRGDRYFAPESFGEHHARHLWRKNFYDHLSPETNVCRQENACHAAAAELALEGVIGAQ